MTSIAIAIGIISPPCSAQKKRSARGVSFGCHLRAARHVRAYVHTHTLATSKWGWARKERANERASGSGSHVVRRCETARDFVEPASERARTVKRKIANDLASPPRSLTVVVARDATIRGDVALSDASCTRSRLPAIADVVQTPREARSTCVFYLIAFYPIRVNLCACVRICLLF